MPSCEKCWMDSAPLGDSGTDDHAAAFRALVDARDAKGETCTPEEQAGIDAEECPLCHRDTIHQHARVCMTPNCAWVALSVSR